MQFALLGNHPDGLEMTAALLASGRHQLLYVAGTALSSDARPGWPDGVKQVHDLEEVLADPAVELVIVASGPANRPAQLRRACSRSATSFASTPPTIRRPSPTRRA